MWIIILAESSSWTLPCSPHPNCNKQAPWWKRTLCSALRSVSIWCNALKACAATYKVLNGHTQQYAPYGMIPRRSFFRACWFHCACSRYLEGSNTLTASDDVKLHNSIMIYDMHMTSTQMQITAGRLYPLQKTVTLYNLSWPWHLRLIWFCVISKNSGQCQVAVEQVPCRGRHDDSPCHQWIHQIK